MVGVREQVERSQGGELVALRREQPDVTGECDRVAGDVDELCRAQLGEARDDLLARELGLDLPFWQQYLRYLGRLLQGDLGRSYLQRTEVSTLIVSRLPATLILMALATGFFLLGGIQVGGDTLLRFYVMHVIAFPLITAIFLIVHFWRIRKDGGISGPV